MAIVVDVPNADPHAKARVGDPCFRCPIDEGPIGLIHEQRIGGQMSGEHAVDSSAVHDVEIGEAVAVEVGKCRTRAMSFGIVVGPGSAIEVAEFDPGLGRDLAESREGESRFLIVAAARQNGCCHQSNSQHPTDPSTI